MSVLAFAKEIRLIGPGKETEIPCRAGSASYRLSVAESSGHDCFLLKLPREKCSAASQNPH